MFTLRRFSQPPRSPSTDVGGVPSASRPAFDADLVDVNFRRLDRSPVFEQLALARLRSEEVLSQSGRLRTTLGVELAELSDRLLLDPIPDTYRSDETPVRPCLAVLPDR